ncbi:MAG TPA: glycosyltransferase family 2 protein [Bacilli bacterium]|nr:glycosyltransferase family 2 protein [Bacilli bacterium]
MISIVIPCYNEEESLPLFYKAMKKQMTKMKDIKFELVFVNDGSKDKTLEILKDLAKDDNRVKYVSFSRNFGKEAAMLAGLEHITGDYIAIMDADLQDPPELLEKMYEGIQEGYDCVALRRVNRKGDPVIRSFFADLYYKIINKMSKVPIVNGARDFRLMSRQMVNSILKLQESNRYSKGLFAWVGYKTKWLEYENVERVAGTSKWSFYKLFLYALESIVAFSTVPLLIAIVVSILFLMAAVAFFIVMLVIPTTLVFKITGLLFFFTGIQILFLGIVSIYISKIQIQTQDRPKYIVKETNIKE